MLDAGAILIAAASLAGTAGDRGAFSLLAAAAALAASTAAWRRGSLAKPAAIAVTCSGAAAGLIAQSGPLAAVLLLAPARIAAHPWRGHAGGGTVNPAGLPFAVIVAVCGVVALASAAGAARGRRASLDVAAVALTPVAFLAAAACGLGYWPLAGLLLALTLGLAGWAAAWPGPVPACAALLTAALALSWGLAAPLPTVLALAASTADCVFVAQRARYKAAGTAAAGLGVLAAAALGAAAVLALGGAAWQAGLAMLDVAVAAVRQDRRQPGLGAPRRARDRVVRHPGRGRSRIARAIRRSRRADRAGPGAAAAWAGGRRVGGQFLAELGTACAGPCAAAAWASGGRVAAQFLADLGAWAGAWPAPQPDRQLAHAGVDQAGGAWSAAPRRSRRRAAGPGSGRRCWPEPRSLSSPRPASWPRSRPGSSE